jgi:hypothetical protein
MENPILLRAGAQNCEHSYTALHFYTQHSVEYKPGMK